jgi:HK97 family phage portal protein
MKVFGLQISRAREKKESASWPAILMMLMGQPVVWTPKDYKSLSQAGYQACMDAYACIDLIAKTIAGIPWVLYQDSKASKGDMTEIDNHPLLDLMRRPNPMEGQARFIEKVVKFYLIAGNSYIEKNGPNKGAPKELWALRPDRMVVVPGNAQQLIAGYKYRVSGKEITFDVSQVLHMKTFHPTDDFYGLSPLEVAARAVDISNFAHEWNAKLLKNDCRPPGALTVEGKLTDQQFERLKKQIKDEISGYENAGTPLLLEGGMDWKNFAISPKDMDWDKADTKVTRKICRVFGVAPELIGDADNKTYSNYQEARLALYMEACLPLAGFVRDELNNWLTPLYGERLRLDLDIDQIEALQKKREEAYARMQGAWWLTLNEKREACGYEEREDGDVILIPLGLTEFGREEEPPAIEDQDQDDQADDKQPAENGKKSMAPPNIKGFWSAPERKQALWTNFASRVAAKEKGFIPEAESYLRSQAKAVKEKIAAAGSPQLVVINSLLDTEDEVKEYVSKFKSRYFYLFTKAGEAGLDISEGKLYEFDEETKGDSRFEFTIDQKAKLEMLMRSSAKFITEETAAEVARALKAAEAENWTIEQTTQEIWQKLSDMAVVRARRIARTETAMVENWGQLEGYKQTEFVDKKGWMCSFVPESREDHKNTDGQEVPIDDAFDVGGEKLDYPGDRSHGAGPGNVINCLCSHYPVVS